MTSANQPKLDRFDRFLPAEPWQNPWQPTGRYEPDLALLATLLSVAAGASQQSGIVAAAADVWAAAELRRAGFDPDEVWPRRTRPRVFPRDLRSFVEGGALPKALRSQVVERLTHSKARQALPVEARVLGAAYSKQADVVIASWAAGVELLISTKTMLSSYQKNLRNRFEEGYGDAKNLRGRHPLAALGFLYVVGSDIPDESLDFAVDMLRKLVREPDVYECACLIVVEGANGADADADADAGIQGPQEDSVLVPVSGADAAGDGEGPPEEEEEDAVAVPPLCPVRLLTDKIPDDLSPSVFFERLVSTALDRMPVAVYPGVRSRIAEARLASEPSF